ncbi:MAG: hypothetical protein K0V04_04685 [Deltaproteobacteria bacterium]|nr:hypothetical protein [Deltaproteobacteria bacterium]
MTEVGEAAATPGTGDEAKADPTLVSARILDGSDTKVLAADRRQFVNLPRDAKWVDAAAGPKNIDRLHIKMRVLITFDRAGAHNFKLKLVPDSTNVVYTGAEKGRNPLFKFQDQEKSYTTEGDGTKIVPLDDFFLDVAGGHLFTFEAEDDFGNKVQSTEVEVSRLFYFQELKMTGSPCATTVSPLVSEFSSNFMVIHPLPSVPMTRIENVSRSAADNAALKSAARTAYAGSTAPSKEPYAVAVAYTDHLAVMTAGHVVTKANIIVGSHATINPVPIPIVNAAGRNKYLWKGIVTGEKWFVSAVYQSDPVVPPSPVPAVPGAPPPVAVAPPPVPMTEADFTPVPDSPRYPDRCKSVEVDVSKLPRGRGTITLTVNIVDMMRGGLAYPGTNLVVVCTKAWWVPKNTTDQNQIMIHEVGHKVYMVSDGTGKLPDKPAKHYTGRGHRGDHCHQGIALATTFSSTTGTTCVMFGATNGVSTFCSDCSPAVVKMDISDGWSAL